ncbi:MAG: Phosphofructokinase, partial [Bacteroidetes bacterium 38_7]
PKTIDNDLPLPDDIRTFGFETAREIGTMLAKNIMEDARTGQRWFLVVTMGRRAGHLALGIGKSAGATLTLIPEEWEGREILLQEVVDILVTSILKRYAENRPYGVAMIAEGVIEQMDLEALANLTEVERDSHGHIRLSEINFSDTLKRALRKELKNLGIEMRVINKDLGYELRCADPIAFDIDYTRSLGEAAVEFLLNGGSHATITIQHDDIAFGRMISHTIGSKYGFGIFHFQTPQIQSIPLVAIFFFNKNIFAKIDFTRRNIYLNISSRFEFQKFAFGEF